MKAVLWKKYGPPEVLVVGEVAKPIPNDDEVLIKIHASTVTAGDCEMRRFEMPLWLWVPIRLYMGLFRPRFSILGQELAGTVEAVGKNVMSFRPGDAVFAPTQMSLGAHAEYLCLPEKYAIGRKPPQISFEAAATIPTGGLNALHFVREGGVGPGKKVLINGAGGCIGTYVIQIAKSMGAEVTAVDIGSKLDVLRSIGADHVIDYTREDFGESDEKYDVIIDNVGKRAFARCVRALAPGGTCVMGNPRFSGIMRGLFVSMFSNKKVFPALAPYKKENLVYLAGLAQDGVLKPVIDKAFSLEQMIDAHRYVESGQKKGNVVINISNDGNS